MQIHRTDNQNLKRQKLQPKFIPNLYEKNALFKTFATHVVVGGGIAVVGENIKLPFAWYRQQPPTTSGE